jgi:anti-sigma regulatory factor (Ser/Thr protein kinase)
MGMKRSFDRRISALDDVFEFVDEFVDTSSLATGTSFALRLAIEEIFTNFVKYNESSPAQIDLELVLRDSDAVAVLVDQESQPYDIWEHEEVDTEADLRNRDPGGLGIHLVKRMLDEVRYDHAEGTTIITLVKKNQE